jgi:hypothetical protein
MTDLDFMEALKILERYVSQAMAQAEIMEKAARALERIQAEMQGQIDHVLLRPSSSSSSSKANTDDHWRRLAWLESFEQEGGLRAQVEVAARAMGLEGDGRRRRSRRCCRRMT